MRFVVARRLGRRGEGLGNEILPWAKGLIASEELGARLIGPSWGLNKRRYYRNFGTSRLDFIAEDLLRQLPHHAFTQQDYMDTGEIPFGAAIKRWASQRGLLQRRSWIVTVDGMYGGYPSIWNARPLLAAKLLNSRDTLRNMYQVLSGIDRSKLFVAVHMRFGGDFVASGPNGETRGVFNLLIPGEWYLNVCEELKRRFGERIHFHFFTDRGGPAYEEAVRRFNPTQVRQQGLTECSDLLLMAEADLRICSVSSYSLIASFLSGGAYVWYEPQLSRIGGQYSLWGNDPDQRKSDSLTRQSMEAMQNVMAGSSYAANFKGYPVGAEGVASEGLIQHLDRLLLQKTAGNLLEYGTVPEWLSHPHA